MDNFHNCIKCDAIFLPLAGENIAYCDGCAFKQIAKDMKRISADLVDEALINKKKSRRDKCFTTKVKSKT